MKQIRKWINYPESLFRLVLSLSFPLVLVLIALIYFIGSWEKKSLDDIQMSNMTEFSRAFFSHIVSSNIWSKSHDGIFIEIRQHSGEGHLILNNHLSVMGKNFIKIDPLYLTPQITELLNKRSAYKFRIISPAPLSPASVPDRWEASALAEFARGKKEASTIVEINNKRFYRFIAPLALDRKCLQCHLSGDGDNRPRIAGGLSLEIPLETTDRLFAVQLKRSALSFATFGLLVIVFIIGLTVFFSKRINDAFREKTRQQEILGNLNAQLSFLSARDRKILASIGDGIAIINELGVIENVNTSFETFTGILLSEMMNRKVAEFEKKSLLHEIFCSQTPVEITIRDRILVLTEVPVKDKQAGKLLCTLRIVHDATDEKLSAAIALAGAAAHEVRQPLSILLSMMDLLREKSANGGNISEEIAVLEKECTRINDIISRMLSISLYRTKQYTEETRIFDL